MNEPNTIPFHYVFYKTDDTPGWLVARFTGTEDEVLAKIKEYNWKEYKIFDGGEVSAKFIDEYSDSVPYNLEPEITFLTSDWIYSGGKWFLPDGKIPIPLSYDSEGRDCSEHGFSFSVEYEEYRNSDLDEIADEVSEECGENVFYSVAKVRLNGFEFEWEYCDSYFKAFSEFFENLKQKEFATISIEEYYHIKILAWNLGRGIRVKIQDYDGNETVAEPVDICMDKVAFISKCKELLDTLQKKHDFYKRKFNRCTETVGKYYFDTSVWRWALVGNIVREHECGEKKEIRSGTKHFFGWHESVLRSRALGRRL